MKNSNIEIILKFAKDNNTTAIQGTKLKALYTLIQRSGQTIETDDEKLNGLKCLEVMPGKYVAMTRTGAKDRFFPCVIKTHYLESI